MPRKEPRVEGEPQNEPSRLEKNKRRSTRWPGIYSYETQRRGTLYGVRFRDQYGRTSEKRGFRTQRAAKGFRDQVANEVRSEEYIAPSEGRITLNELDAEFRAANSARWKQTYKVTRESTWRVQVSTTLGRVEVRQLTERRLQAWINGKFESGTSSKYCAALLQHVRAVLGWGVRNGVVRKNVADRVARPRKDLQQKRNYLSVSQVRSVADSLDEFHRAVFLALVFTGMRWGELAALEVGSVDLERGRATVRRGATRVHAKGGGWQVSPPKNSKVRQVPLPRHITCLLADLVAGKKVGELVFPPQGRTEFLSPPGRPAPGRTPSKVTNWLWMACVEVGVEPVTPHELRHTYASLAVQAGASVKVIQNALGHASAAMTLDTYADLFNQDLDNVADRLFEGWSDED